MRRWASNGGEIFEYVWDPRSNQAVGIRVDREVRVVLRLQTQYSTPETLLDHGEAPAVVALATPLAAAAALEGDQALVHGLALPLVVDPDAVVILIQVDRGVIAGLARVAAIRLERGDGGAPRDVRVALDLGALLPCVGSRRARRGLHKVDAVACADHATLEGLGMGGDVGAIRSRHGGRLRGGAGRAEGEHGDAADARQKRLPSRPAGQSSGFGFHELGSYA